MKRSLIILLALLSALPLKSQVRTMLIHKKSGELMSLPMDNVDSVTFVQTENVQHDRWFFMLENPGIADYLRDFEYDDEDYSYHKIFDYRGEPYLDARQDWPYGVELADTVLYNLIPNRSYSLQIHDRNVSFQTLGQLRMIKLKGVNNVRDLGGWATMDGRHLRYGCIIRGPELSTTLPETDPSASLHQATDQDLVELRDHIGIKAELDLREAYEIKDRDAGSVLGSDIWYRNEEGCSPSPIHSPNPAWADALRFILSCLSNDHTVYLHCRWGADRTGLLCMLIEGALGVSESNLAKDFELTSFAGNTRYRTDARFRESIEYIKQQEGSSLQEKFRTYWLSCGASNEELDALHSLLTE